MFTKSCVICDKGLFNAKKILLAKSIEHPVCSVCDKFLRQNRFVDLTTMETEKRTGSLKHFFIIRVRFLFEPPVFNPIEFTLECGKCHKQKTFTHSADNVAYPLSSSFKDKYGWDIQVYVNKDEETGFTFPKLKGVLCPECLTQTKTRRTQIINYMLEKHGIN